MTDGKRIHFLDELRGLCVVYMVFYHGFYTAGYLFDNAAARDILRFFMPTEPVIAFLFIFICGISSRLSSNNPKRGILVLAAGVLVSVVTLVFVPSQAIYFGVLHLLGVSILLFSVLKRALDKLPAIPALAASLLLFFVTYGVPHGVLGINGILSYPLPDSLYSSNLFYIFGFPAAGVYASDYFPLLPWLFAFFAGAFAGRYLLARGFPTFMYKSRVRLFSFAGKNAFLVYLIHQPIIFAVFFLLSFIPAP